MIYLQLYNLVLTRHHGSIDNRALFVDVNRRKHLHHDQRDRLSSRGDLGRTPDMNRISHRTTQVDSVDLVSCAYDLDVISPDA